MFLVCFDWSCLADNSEARDARRALPSTAGSRVRLSIRSWGTNVTTGPSRLPVYRVETVKATRDLVRKWADVFGVNGEVTTIPSDVEGAPGLWILDRDKGSGRTRTVYVSERSGVIGYSSGDDGHRWDQVNHKKMIHGIPEPEECMRRLGDLLVRLDIPRSAFGLERGQSLPKYKQRLTTVKYVPRGSTNRVEIIKKRSLAISQHCPPGTILGENGFGEVSVAFISESKISTLEIGYLKISQYGDCPGVNREELQSRIERGEGRSSQREVPRSVDINGCAIRYSKSLTKTGDILLFPCYELAWISELYVAGNIFVDSW